MTKLELVGDIVRNADGALNATQVEACLDALGGAVRMCLVNEGQVSLPGIGRLKTKQRAARVARNPRTGATIQVPPKKAVVFSPCKVIKEYLNS